MKNKTLKYNLYTFDELAEDIQEKVVEDYAEVNVDYEWWIDDNIYSEIAKEYGIYIDMNEVSFSLDRENYVAFDTYNHGQKGWKNPIYVEDKKMFCKKAGVKHNKDGYISINHNHYAGGIISNFVEDDGYTEEDDKKMNECLNEMLDEIKAQLKSDYEGRTSEESIIDFIQTNDFEFLKDGTNKIIV